MAKLSDMKMSSEMGRNLTYGMLDMLGKAIVTGQYDNQPFPTEADLAKQYDVSRSVVREAVGLVGPKTYYIEGETEPSRLRLFLRATAAYLALHFGPNDGVVARGDQSLASLGTSLGVFDVGHSDFTRNRPGSRAGKRSRKALMDAIVMAVGRSGS